MDKEFLFKFLHQELQKIKSEHETQWILDWVFIQKATDTESLIKQVIARRQKNEPLAYIFGSWAFRDLELAVGPGVLIPRPETEELVDLVLAFTRELVQKTPHNEKPICWADLGSGSGAIGIAIANELKISEQSNEAWLVEASADALAYLQKNHLSYFLKADLGPQVYAGTWTQWAASIEPSSIDFLVSNPPYISANDWQSLDSGVRDFEPASALVPRIQNPDPLALGCYLEILEIAIKVLRPGGALFFEMGTQAEETLKLIQKNPALNNSQIHFDLSGKKRFISLRKA